ncbi:MAG: 2-amino-4-hydroxy-6-hydroxymethyldihydropteridine diphosphokinase [Gammaproteobacteria bacterium]|nr:MAG: 2-amino-4-hydroxy-6-hydroxymethyldihydropteridine diphosphokinase [Gammaproteobacteria bacterium]
MTAAYIALGSNLQDPLTQLRSAVSALDKLPGSRVERTSSIYRSTPVGPVTQPDYLNAVLLLTTVLSPLRLLDALQQIEQEQGRVRGVRWGPRTLDLDILLYNDQHIDSPRLAIPHPALQQRNFVLYPLFEISDANLVLPDGAVLDTLVAACPRDDLEKTSLRFNKN